jgi:hypothetical protein
MRKRIRRHDLAEHFSVDIRTIDAWAKKGVLPEPHYLEGSHIPFWFTDETVDRPPSRKSEKTVP